MLTYMDLVNDMTSGCRPRKEWKIGIEHEQFVFNIQNNAPLPYDGSPGIKQILEAFEAYGWHRHEKNGYLIEMEREGALITLEPGGQMELAGSAHKTLHAVKAQADRFYQEFKEIGAKLGFGILAKGFHPAWTREDVHRMPKERYGIMEPYMLATNKHGVDMMIRTCGAQVNMDFSSEEDMIKKFRVGLAIQPVVTALMANSNLVEGQDSGYKSFRSFIWTETDPARCGVPAFIFSDEMSFARYVDYALDVPMYFIIRDGHHVSMIGKSFRDFMKEESAVIGDWHDHLTTLFPEIRLKKYLEFRGPDSTDKAEVYAMAAFWAGIYYNDTALDAAWELIKDWSAQDHERIRNEVPKLGLETTTPNGTLRDLGLKAIEVAKKGLQVFEPEAVGDLDVFIKKLS